MICGSTVYRWVDGRPTAVADVSQDWDPEANAYVKVIQKRARGRLVKVRRETRVVGHGGVDLLVVRFPDGRWVHVETVREEPNGNPPCWNILEEEGQVSNSAPGRRGASRAGRTPLLDLPTPSHA